MTNANFTDLASARAAGIEYMLLVGRRQIGHIAHQASGRRAFDAGFKPIFGIGSVNGAKQPNGLDDPFFEPFSNPLTFEQQRAQLKEAYPDKIEGIDYFVVALRDLGDNEAWCRNVADQLKGQIKVGGVFPDLTKKTALHFIGREEDKRPRRLVTEDGQAREVMAYFWEGIFPQLGLPVVHENAHEGIGFGPSGTALRSLDINDAADPRQKWIAAPHLVRQLVTEARASNPDAELLNDVPLTALDLSLQRLREEKGITTRQIVERLAEENSAITVATIAAKGRELNGSMRQLQTRRMKVASASLNQTVYNFATNLPNILRAVDRAVEDKADVLCLEELGLTGYAADDGHQWFRNETVWPHIQTIARYAQAKNPNLVISLGTPWIFADKEAAASENAYNINNRPYNTQMFLSGGKVVAMGAKSILADGPAEYEPHQFRDWPVREGTVPITLPDGSRVPFGKPILALEQDGKRVTLFHEQCAEAWSGVHDDQTIDMREQNQARVLIEKARTHDIGLAINPSASKPQPELNKETLRMKGLAETGSNYAGAYVYTNYLGSGSGTYAAEGSQIFAQDGKTLHHGQRYSFADMSYSSMVFDLPLAERGAPDAQVAHHFQAHAMEKTGEEAAFESRPGDQLIHEEYARSISLWLRDYMAKQPWACQGYIVSLSGGKDSAYGAVAVRMMVDLEVKDNGIDGFFRHFPNVSYKDEVLKVYAAQGEEAAKDAIMRNLLTCVYLATENSSQRTENAARMLIEGGEVDGRTIKGIGGTFQRLDVQPALEENILGYSGLNLSAAATAHRAVSAAEQQRAASGYSEEDRQTLAILDIKRLVHAYINAPEGDTAATLPNYISTHCVNAIPNWREPKYDAALQNIQARVRQPFPWLLANTTGRIPLVTSNQSEGVLGYATFGGDMHMGGANPIGGIGKDRLTEGLAYFEKFGLAGLAPVESLALVNREKPSAELRQEKEGEAPQTDEKDIGFSYRQGDKVSQGLITQRLSVSQVLDSLKEDNAFPDDPAALRDILAKLAHRWDAAQFKRIASVLAPYLGNNVDPHQSVRTTVLGDNFRTGLATITLDIMAEKLGGEVNFRLKTGLPLEEAKYLASIDAGVKKHLNNESFAKLIEPEAIKTLKEKLLNSEQAALLEFTRTDSWRELAQARTATTVQL